MDKWEPEPLALNEEERRAAHFAITARLAVKRAKPKPKKFQQRQAQEALYSKEAAFLESLNVTVNPLEELGHFEADRDGIVAGIEGLQSLLGTIRRNASVRGAALLAFNYAEQFANSALDRFMQAAPVELHEEFDLEVTEGRVRFAKVDE